MTRLAVALTCALSTLVTGLTLISAAPARATTMVYRTLPELVADSHLVIQGRVSERESFWEGTRIMTRARVDVDDVWLGRAPPTPYVDVITLGGVVGDIGQRVDGAASLPLKQHVVLQLKPRGGGEFMPVAMAQGVWFVQPESGTFATISRPFADRLVLREGQIPDAPPHTLAELKRAILEAAGGR